MNARTLVPLAAALLATPACGQVAPFEWQKPQAKVLPQGELEWTPQPFRFTPGPTVRYIDFGSGRDDNPGTKERPWKHHPWDPNAGGLAKASKGPVTYVFKGGVTYRGRFEVGDDRGVAGNPIRLTRDPAWGQGAAEIRLSEPVTGWKRGAATPGLPNPERVWSAEVDFLPRTLWRLGGDGTPQRLTLARHPNWKESDPNDVLREWWAWEQPRWWEDNSRFHRMRVGDRDLHLGISTEHFNRPAADYVGATVWTEWSIVMGSPYPARIEAFDAAQKGVAFRGPWTFDMLEVITKGNRFHLEDKAWMLDEGGEFWVERLGDARARIYLRLPNDADPNAAQIEAGRYVNGIDAKQMHHIEISGLTFRFSNVHWEYFIPNWAHPDMLAAVVRLNGPGDDVAIRNNRFEHVNMPIRLRQGAVDSRIGHVSVTDNVMEFTDHGAIQASARFGEASDTRFAPLDRIEFLRNRLHHIGWRIVSGEHGHAINLEQPTESHVAGNFLHRIAGWGISVSGGKPSGVQGVEIPFNRHLVHHNRVEDVLVKSNDWGGIETWQGGPHYVFNNLVINPIAFKHWVWREGDPTNLGSFGHAYYLDGSFKNVLFNNIASGRNNTLGTRSVNTTGLQGIFSFENTFFHNTFFRFAEVSRQQEPSAGRVRYLSNVYDDVSKVLFRHAEPKEGAPDPNASHYTQGGQFAYRTIAYHQNVIRGLRGMVGVFEENGNVYPTLEQFREALTRVRAQVSDVGVLATTATLRDPAKRDFRAVAGGAAIGRGSRVFVPWALSGVCGEWSFLRNRANPREVIDEHWTMTRNYGRRETYKDTPRYPLTGHGFGEEAYGAGTLEDWTDGALRLNGKDQYLSIPGARLSGPPPAHGEAKVTDLPFAKVTAPAYVVPGLAFDVLVELKPNVAGTPKADLHWMRRESYGGFMSWGGNGDPAGDRRFRFRVEPTSPDGLDKYTLLVFVSPDGTLEKKTAEANVEIPRASFERMVNPSFERTVDMATNSFLIEAVVRTSARSGLLVSKSDGKAGYVLDLADGKPRLRLVAAGTALTAVAGVAVSDGKWHHLVVEVNRAAGVTFYIDGKRVAASATGSMPGGSLTNGADFLVGGGPGAAFLAVELDYLRVARGTLADARTTIEELHAWQFAGPQFRDFAGRPRTGKGAAGALLGD